jgi:hypothetical protein
VSPLASWILVLSILGLVAVFVLIADRMVERWWEQSQARRRHPSVMRSHCLSCGDRNVIHMGMHRRLCHQTPAEDRPDWGTR